MLTFAQARARHAMWGGKINDGNTALAAGPVDDPAKEAVEVLADVLCAEVNLVMLIAGVASLVTVRDLLSDHHPEKLARAEAVIARRKP